MKNLLPRLFLGSEGTLKFSVRDCNFFSVKRILQVVQILHSGHGDPVGMKNKRIL